MEQAIRERYNDDIFKQARQRYDIDSKQIRLLDGFESFIYEFAQEGQEYILRIGHSRRRSINQILGELDWINYLAAGGASVAQATLSKRGNLVETVDDDQGGQFLVTGFVKAPGGPAWEKGLWQNADCFESYGRLLGRMHRLSMSYQPPDLTWKRPEWDDPNDLGLDEWLPASDAVVLEKFEHLKVHLQALPKSRESYGLIHQDAHAGNLFLDDEGNLTLFDFDDCCYGWYAYDLAMVLFYAITNRDDANEFGPRFWHRFMLGYQHESRLDPAWLSEIPHFMKLREMDIYAALHRSKDITLLDLHNWDGQFMAGRRKRILNEIPCIEFELTLP